MGSSYWTNNKKRLVLRSVDPENFTDKTTGKPKRIRAGVCVCVCVDSNCISRHVTKRKIKCDYRNETAQNYIQYDSFKMATTIGSRLARAPVIMIHTKSLFAERWRMTFNDDIPQTFNLFFYMRPIQPMLRTSPTIIKNGKIKIKD